MLRHASRRHRAALITLGFLGAAGVGTLGAPSLAEARSAQPGSTQARKKTAAKPAAKPATKPTAKSAAAAAAVATTAPQQGPDGKQIFSTTCAACHQATGLGVEGTYPPLAGSDWVNGDDGKLARIILHGLTGPVEVAGETYAGAMPPWGGVLKDADIAAVATYIRSAWGNKAAPVTTAKVAGIRSANASRKTPWTAPELTQVPAGK